ncbi:MAG: chorismate-binding protein [Deltaproteobacteria bacterium]|nr:chorismate-binding protein [Deltaproteobacteria bacterium]
MSEITSRTIDAAGLGPLEIYARLRAQAPDRPSFLLESLLPDEPEGRYSIVGYRVRAEEMLPPGADALTGQVDDLRQRGDAPASLAEALALGAVGYFGYGLAHVRLGIKPWEDEGPAGRFVRRAVVGLLDHRDRTLTFAAPAQGKGAERAAWELEHASALPPPPGLPDPAALPCGLAGRMDDAKLGAKIARAKAMLGGPIEEIVLAHTLCAPQAGADPLDAYRALRALCPAPHMYYLDFCASPMAPGLQVLGAAHGLLGTVRPSERGVDPLVQWHQSMRAAFPAERLVGRPPQQAAQLVRKLEDTSRELFGGAVGYLAPGPRAAFALCERAIVCCFGAFEHTVAVPVGPGTDPGAAPAACLAQARPVLAAIRAAQDGAAGRRANG